MAVDRVRIDFRHDQRDFGIHPPIAAFVHHHGTGIDSPRCELGGDFIRRAGNHQVTVVECTGLEQFNFQHLAAHLDFAADRPLRSQQFQTLVGEFALL